MVAVKTDKFKPRLNKQYSLYQTMNKLSRSNTNEILWKSIQNSKIYNVKDTIGIQKSTNMLWMAQLMRIIRGLRAAKKNRFLRKYSLLICNFMNRQFLAELATRCSILRKKFRQVILFWCHEMYKCRIANATESNSGTYFRNQENSGTRFEHLFLTSSGSHFFNKTDFEQHFLIWNELSLKR